MKEVKIVNKDSDKIPEKLGVSKWYESFVDHYLKNIEGSDKNLSDAICELANEAESENEAAYGCYMIGQYMGQKLI